MLSMTTTDKQRLTVFLKPDLIRHAKAEAVIKNSTVADLIVKALVAYLPEEIKSVKPKF